MHRVHAGGAATGVNIGLVDITRPAHPSMRIGIFGGTFDPIHYGHLIAAKEVRQRQRLDRVLFVPANRSPLKPTARASTGHRVAMVRLAIADNPAFALSTIDVERPAPSFAVETVAVLRRGSPADCFVFLIGADQLAELPQWRAPEQLLQAVPLVAFTRPGAGCATEAALAQLSPAARERITLQEMPAVDVSASEIRERVAQGTDIRHLTPPQVAEYIETNNLYRPHGVDEET